MNNATSFISSKGTHTQNYNHKYNINTRTWISFDFVPGHPPLLQSLVSLLAPLQAFPPFWAAVTIVLVLSCNPFPQDLEHFDHPPQEDHLQCTEKLNEIILIINLGTFLL